MCFTSSRCLYPVFSMYGLTTPTDEGESLSIFWIDVVSGVLVGFKFSILKIHNTFHTYSCWDGWIVFYSMFHSICIPSMGRAFPSSFSSAITDLSFFVMRISSTYSIRYIWDLSFSLFMYRHGSGLLGQ